MRTADQFYTKLLEESPDSVDILLAQAEVRQNLNRFSERMEGYLAAEKLAPDNLMLLLKLSHYYRVNDSPDLKNRQLALEKAQRAVELYPEDPGAWTLVSFAHLELNEKEKAVQAMRQAADFSANRGDRAHRLANAFWFQGQNAEAAEQFLNAAQWGAADPSVMYARCGLCLIKLKRYEEAVESLTKSIDLDSYQFEPLLWRGIAFQGLGKEDLAVADFKRGLALRPGEPRFLTPLLNHYEELNDFESAAELLNSRDGDQPHDHTLLQDDKLAWIERSGHQPLLEARDRFLARLESQASYRANRTRMRARELKNQRLPHDCIQLLRDTNEEAPEFVHNYILLGMTLRKWLPIDDVNEATEQEAIRALRKAVEVDPSQPAAHDQLSRALATTHFENLRSPEEAVFHAERAIALKREEETVVGAYLLGTVGMAYYRAGKFKQAIEALQSARELPGEHWVPTELFLAMCYWQLGDREQARRWFEEGLRVTGTQPADLLSISTLAEARELLKEILTPDESGSTLNAPPKNCDG